MHGSVHLPLMTRPGLSHFMLFDSLLSASESKLLGEAFPFYVGVCLVRFLANLPSEVSFSFGEGHPGILAYRLVELGCLVAKEGKIFRQHLWRVRALPQREACLGPVEGMQGSRRSMEETCVQSPRSVQTFWRIGLELGSFSLYFSGPIYVKEIFRITS